MANYSAPSMGIDPVHIGTISVDDLNFNYSSLNYSPNSASTANAWLSSNPTSSSGFSWTNGNGVIGSSYTTQTTQPSLHVTNDAEFDGDIKWKGRSLGTLLTSIEDRLAILADPDPKKLEKFAALKKAYDNYKLLEKLCNSK